MNIDFNWKWLAGLSLGLWIFGIWYLARHWATLPEWARVIGVLGLLPVIITGPVGTIITIIVVAIGQGKRMDTIIKK